MATKYDKAVNYLIDYKEYDNEYVDNFTKPYEIDSDFKESVETLQELIDNQEILEMQYSNLYDEMQIYKKAFEISVKKYQMLLHKYREVTDTGEFGFSIETNMNRILNYAREELENGK